VFALYETVIRRIGIGNIAEAVYAVITGSTRVVLVDEARSSPFVDLDLNTRSVTSHARAASYNKLP